jgi:hypothetical protein
VAELNLPLDKAQPRKMKFSPDAPATLQQLADALREELLVDACDISTDGEITGDDLAIAYRSLSHRDSEARKREDAQSVITRALRENWNLEFCSYVMAVLLFVFGLTLLTVGVFSADSATRIGAFIGGSTIEVLILIPFRVVINSRRHNIALRMLGLVLNRVRDPSELAPLVREVFVAVVLGQARFNAGK